MKEDKKRGGEYTESIQVRCSPEQKIIFERQAIKDGITISAYLRLAAMLDCCICGDSDALKMLFTAVKNDFRFNIRSLFFSSRISNVSDKDIEDFSSN